MSIWANPGKLVLDILTHISSYLNITDIRIIKNKPSKNICDYAICNGHLSLLQWAIDNQNECIEASHANAIKYGHLHILQWITDTYYSVDLGEIAVTNGQLYILQQQQNRKYRWNFMICSRASINGHLHILQWAHANGYFVNDIMMYRNARLGGHHDTANWLQRYIVSI